MKNLKYQRLSLSMQQNKEIENSILSKITGGGQVGNCGCGCNGPSSTCDNGRANYNNGLYTPGSDTQACVPTNGWAAFSFWRAWHC